MLLTSYLHLLLKWKSLKLAYQVGVLRGSRVKCLTHSPGVLGSSRTGSSGFFQGSVLGQDTSEPQPTTGETREDMSNMSCCRDKTKILLKAT